MISFNLSNKFANYSIERKKTLTDFELNLAFEIVKKNVLALGVMVSESDKAIWKNSLLTNLKNEEFYFYFLHHKNDVAGFLELIVKDGKLSLSEIQLTDKFKRTFMLVYALTFVLNSELFSGFDEVYFSIKKENTASSQTFTHLGGIAVKDLGKNILYKISRADVEKYFKNIKN